MAPSGIRGSKGVDNPLFENLAFWISSTVPQKQRFRELLQENGGRVVIGEGDADYRLVDHMRKDVAPGTYSYQFVEKSIQNGALEDPEKYRAGSSTRSTRPVGSTTIPSRHRRIPFSAKDDQILYDWVKPFEEKGGAFRGNKIYEQLEEQYPHHTAQSWRDRYLKRLRERPRPAAQGDNAQPAPPSTHEAGLNRPSNQAPAERPAQDGFGQFTTAEKEILLEEANAILEVDPSREDEAWEEFAKANPAHSANEWKSFFHTVVRPQQKQMKGGRENVDPRIEVVVDNRTPGPSSTGRAPQKAEGTSLSRKRRPTDVESANSPANESHSPPHHKRRATDHVYRETREGATKTVTPPRPQAPVGRIQESRRQASNINTSKDTPGDRLEPHAVNESGASRRSTSVATSENEQFETAPQFQPAPDRSNGQSPPLDDMDDLFDVSVPGHPKREGDASEDENATEEIEQLEDWISSCVRSGKSANEEQAIEALRCTTMDFNLADRVLPYLKSGKGIPANMRGVWTAEDDRCMEGQDARDFARAEKKHGEKLTSARLEYLEARRTPPQGEF